MTIHFYQVKRWDTPLVPCVPDIITRSLHFNCQSPIAPLRCNHLASECISLQISSLCFFSKNTPVEYTSSTAHFQIVPIPRIPRKFGQSKRGHFGWYLKSVSCIKTKLFQIISQLPFSFDNVNLERRLAEKLVIFAWKVLMPAKVRYNYGWYVCFSDFCMLVCIPTTFGGYSAHL